MALFRNAGWHTSSDIKLAFVEHFILVVFNATITKQTGKAISTIIFNAWVTREAKARFVKELGTLMDVIACV